MTWEDDALFEYEQNKAKALEKNSVASQRTLEKHSYHEWNALLKAFEDGCNRLNVKAGHPVVSLCPMRLDHMKILREDDATLEGKYVSDMRTATFTSDALPFAETLFELSMRPVDDNKVFVWISGKEKKIEQTEDIVESILGKFLRGEYVP